MKVKDLIEQLQRLPEDYDLSYIDNNNYISFDINTISIYKKSKPEYYTEWHIEHPYIEEVSNQDLENILNDDANYWICLAQDIDRYKKEIRAIQNIKVKPTFEILP